MRKVLGICGALGLAFLWACTEVELLLPPRPTLPIDRRLLHPEKPPEKVPISLSKFKEKQKNKQTSTQSQKGLAMPCTLIESMTLDVNSEQQETPTWCWAATSRMVMEYHNELTRSPTDLQCEIVAKSLGRANCCPGKTSTIPTYQLTCERGEWPSVVFELYDFDYDVVKAALDWESLTSEICANRPLLYVVKFNGGGRHALVVTGYSAVQGTHVVQTYDPTHNDFEIKTYDEFAGDVPGRNDSNPSYGPYYGFTHDRDYALISPKAGGQP